MQATIRFTINFSDDSNLLRIGDRFTILTHIWESSFSMRVGIESQRNETKRNEGGDSAAAAVAIPDAIARKTRHANAKKLRFSRYYDLMSLETVKTKVKGIKVS